jgi:hypothetical protein
LAPVACVIIGYQAGRFGVQRLCVATVREDGLRYVAQLTRGFTASQAVDLEKTGGADAARAAGDARVRFGLAGSNRSFIAACTLRVGRATAGSAMPFSRDCWNKRDVIVPK